ncbi:MAG TPA: hypothetical protein PKW18_12450 [Candidatus Sumerlaeota bacterium]|nr:MAG: hypothetical protein BWY12_02601 [candidate division BRC1 bacterium ADurb.Bin183]HOE64861.1 hypothetical protein [Candidatus Sumerlaeota bacterium]HRR32312.1 hypothetical protein [Candidatus Sumerlaeia bacterium]HON49665.1 hypothetical protein [Candidatus Sumerlaeota bacterium]HOR64088.1 hypothetical protein [Candidatus Sumerlaeota bacterium]
MSDPIKPVIEKIKSSPKLKSFCEINKKREKPFTESFLNKVAEAFERYGFETTKTFLLDKRQRQATKYQAEVLLEILNYLDNKVIHQNRDIGRLIIKTLNEIKPIE